MCKDIAVKGTIKKVDDLGRIVIPKEIRRTLHIREGDPVEFIVKNNSIILKKYSPLREIVSLATQYVKALDSIFPYSILVTNQNCVIAASGENKSEYLGKSILQELKEVTDIIGQNPFIHPIEECNCVATIVCPIRAQNEVYGYVVMLADNKLCVPSEGEIRLIKSTAEFLESQLAD